MKEFVKESKEQKNKEKEYKMAPCYEPGKGEKINLAPCYERSKKETINLAPCYDEKERDSRETTIVNLAGFVQVILEVETWENLQDIVNTLEDYMENYACKSHCIDEGLGLVRKMVWSFKNNDDLVDILLEMIKAIAKESELYERRMRKQKEEKLIKKISEICEWIYE